MKMNAKLKSVAVAVAFAGLAFSQATNAAQINVMFGLGQNTIEDTSAERILRDGVAVTDGEYMKGDIIQSILRFTTANNQTIGDTLAAPYQLTAYSELLIDDVIDLGGGFVQLVFAPTGNLGLGVMAELYERTSGAQPGFNTNVDPATGIANVLGQTLIAEFGFGDADDFWTATAPNDIGTIAGATPGSGQAPSGIFGLTVLTNDGGFGPIATNGIQSALGTFHDVVGDASVFAKNTGVHADWLASDNINVTFRVVPEPGTLALLGLGLLGLGFGARNRYA